jgi:hypothetical protein
MSAPSLKVVVAITSPIAFQTLINDTVVNACIQESLAFISNYGSQAHLAIAGSKEALSKISNISFEEIVCDPNDPHQLALGIQSAANAELVMIHDSQRALVKSAQFDRVCAALADNIDAVRPVSAFTETLKSVTADRFVSATVDRNSMARVSTPQLIRVSAIDCESTISTWFVPLLANAKVMTAAADPESARINSNNELKLLQNLLDLK